MNPTRVNRSPMNPNILNPNILNPNILNPNALNRTRKTRRRGRTRSRGRRRPTLRFTPYAWAKLLCLRDLGPTEVGGFGVTADGDPLLVEDLRLVRQACTAVTVRFDDAAVADHFDECVDAGLPPERFARVWVHTHPGDCPRPSGTDERTFARVFGGCDWAVMFVLARGGATYARLRFNAGPAGELVLPVEVDYSAPFEASDPAGWAGEYARCVSDESAAWPFGDDFGGASRDLAGAGLEPSGLRRFEPSDRFGLADLVSSDPESPFDFDFPSDPGVWEFHDEREYERVADAVGSGGTVD